jgi:hypothetical protein
MSMMQYFDLYKGLIEDDMTDSEVIELKERIHTCEKAICNTLDRVEAIENQVTPPSKHMNYHLVKDMQVDAIRYGLEELEHRFNQHEAKELRSD